MQSRPYPYVVHWGLVLVVALFVGWAVWELTPLIVLPPFLAHLAEPTVQRWQTRLGSRALAVTAMLLVITGIYLATLLFVLVPLAMQVVKLAQHFPDLMQTYTPEVRRLMEEVETKLTAYNLLEKDLDVALGDLVTLLSKTFSEGGGAVATLTHVFLTPLTLIGKGMLVLVLVGFNLGYWPDIKAGTRSLLNHYTPGLAWWVDETAPEIQKVGRDVAFGYVRVVCVLIPIFFVFFTLMVQVFPARLDMTLLNILVISICFGIVSAIPALGAKVGLAATVLAVMLVFNFSWLSTIITVVFSLLITTLESKFLTPKLMGKALGLNSAIILTIALVSILLGGVEGTLWTIFVGLVVLIAVHRVYTRQPALVAKEEFA